MSFNPETNVIIEDMLNQYSANELIPFVGAGFSCNIKGFNGWEAFIKKLEKYIYLDTGTTIDLKDTFNENWMEATEYYYWLMGKRKTKDANKIVDFGKEEFKNVLNKVFDTLDVVEIRDNESEFEQHILLTNLFKKIYTTNWDRNIENVALHNGPGFTKYVSDIYTGALYVDERHNSVSDSCEDLIEIYKYHGCCNSPTNAIVASESDYFARLRNLDKNALDTQLKNDLGANSFVFFGYSLNDINVNYFLHQTTQIVRQINMNVSNQKACKRYILLYNSKSKINPEKRKFYSNHNMTELVPLLTEDEQHKFDIADKDKHSEDIRIIKKQKIIEFLKLFQQGGHNGSGILGQ